MERELTNYVSLFDSMLPSYRRQQHFYLFFIFCFGWLILGLSVARVSAITQIIQGSFMST